MPKMAIRTQLQQLASQERARTSARFFKTGPGQYGEGDQFIGIAVPQLRKIARQFADLPLSDIDELLRSPIHEERQIALMLLVGRFTKANDPDQKTLYDFYMSHIACVNNWDLVDGSAEFIVGPWLKDKDKSILTELAHAENIWERRIAMLATFHYIKQGDPTDAFMIIEILLHDPHDLIQKAVGWMLREIGKRCSQEVEETFLLKHYKTMPRTALRYAIERFPDARRAQYLSGIA